MDLNAVHIDRVLVERTASDVVLRAQFVGLTHAGKGDEDTLDRTACSVRHDTGRLGVYLIHRALRMPDTTHLDLRQQLFVRQQLHVDIEHVVQVQDALLHGRIPDH